MKVRELIDQSLSLIGVKTRGIGNQPGNEFELNYRQLVSIVDQLRISSPYISTDIYTYDQLTNVPYVTIDSMACSQDFESSVIFYMQPVTLADYRKLKFLKKLTNIPRDYFFQKPSTVFVWPQNDTYQFQIDGRKNIAADLTPMLDFDDLPVPRFYQDYIMVMLAKRLAPQYQKEWTKELMMAERDAKSNLDQNTQFDTVINYPGDDSDFLYRPRNFVRHG